MRNYFCSLILCLTIHFCIAQKPIFFNDKIYLEKIEGLKQNSVKGLVSDRNDMIYISTEMGLYRFDGDKLHEVIDRECPNLSKKRINYLEVDPNTGLAYFSYYPDNFSFKILDNKIYKIDKNDLFYSKFLDIKNHFSISDTRIFKKIVTYFNQNRISYNNWDYQTIYSQTKDVYYSQKGTVLMFDKFEKMSIIKHPFSKTLRLLKFGNDIILFDKGKAVILNNGKICADKVEVDTDLALKSYQSNSNTYICGNENEYYFTSKGIIYSLQFKNSKITKVPIVHYDKNDLTTVHFNKKLNIYFIGTSTSGFFIGRPKQFYNLNLENININGCYGIAEGRNGFWYSSSGWIINKSKTKAIFNEKGVSENQRFLLEYKKNVYYQKKNIFFDFITNKRLNSLKMKKSNVEFPATSYTYLKNQFWYSNTKYIYFLVNDTLILDTFLASRIKNVDIFQIMSFEDKLVIATSKGLFIYSPSSKKINIVKGLENKYIRYTKRINKNNFWVGCYGDGLFIVNNYLPYKVVCKDFNMDTAHAIEDDKKGNTWISTNEGLFVVNKKKLINFTLRHEKIECYRYSIKDGLSTNEFNGGCTHPSFKDGSGLLGFPSIKGITWFYPEKMDWHEFKGKIFIDEVYADEEIVDLQNNKYNIPSTAKLISINFSYPYYFNRENLSVEYRFKDSEKWTKLNGNSIKIARTQKGYRYLLIRIKTNGIAKKQNYYQSFAFYFKAKYYETNWFIMLVIILFIIFLYSSYLFGLYFNRKKEIFLKKKIEEKTVELQKIILELKNSKNSTMQSLHEKEVLIKEVHHRVKNNLQLIISMFNIQARRDHYSSIQEFLKKGETRISSMALIHQRLYQRDEALDKINFQLYIEDLVSSIYQTFNNDENNITVKVNTNEVVLNLSTAIPLGLIINELITNALKHAFPNRKKGIVTINIVVKELNQFELIVEDNGVGFNNANIKTKSFGLELISLLASQIKGSVIFENTDTTKFIIIFQEIDV